MPNALDCRLIEPSLRMTPDLGNGTVRTNMPTLTRVARPPNLGTTLRGNDGTHGRTCGDTRGAQRPPIARGVVDITREERTGHVNGDAGDTVKPERSKRDARRRCGGVRQRHVGRARRTNVRPCGMYTHANTSSGKTSFGGIRSRTSEVTHGRAAYASRRVRVFRRRTHAGVCDAGTHKCDGTINAEHRFGRKAFTCPASSASRPSVATRAG